MPVFRHTRSRADVTASGVQNYTAYGPMQELRKIDLGGSYWYKDANTSSQLRRYVDVNPVEGAWHIGNRSDLKFDFNNPGFDQDIKLVK